MNFSGHRPRKRFGQHWLKDPSVLKKIVEAAELTSIDRVLEVGPGRGALTEKLLASPVAAIHAIELDRDLVVGLKSRFSNYSRFTLRQGDVLLDPLMPPDGLSSNKVIANIPYNITGPLLERLVGRLGQLVENEYDLLVLLLQKEVADRILAKPGQSRFSALSVRMQLLSNCRSICDVPPTCFQPSPKVHSTVILIEPFRSKEREDFALESQVEILLNKAFLARRKMLRNSLAGLLPFAELELLADAVGISLEQRPQEISPSKWLAMARNVIKTNHIAGK